MSGVYQGRRMRLGNRTPRLLLIGTGLLVAVLALAGGIFARTNGLEPDRSFGRGGTSTVTLPESGQSVVFGTARTPEGKIVQSVLTTESESGFVVQFTNRGRLDRGFGAKGIAELDFKAGTVDPRDLIVGGRGKIFAAGEGRARGSDTYGTVLASLKPDGRPNRGFIGGGVAVPEELERVTPIEMTFDSKSRIVVVGYLGGIPAANTVVARFLPGGRLDDSFSDDGVKRFSVTKNQLGRSVAIDGKDRIVVGSPGGAPYRHEHYIVRLLPDGRFDGSFGGDGRLEVSALKGDEETADVATDDRNRILVAGEGSARGGMVVRLLPGGGIDRTFGKKGVADFAWFEPTSLALDDDGRIFTIGSDDYAGGEVTRMGRNGKRTEYAFVTRIDYLTDGFVDRRGRLVVGGRGTNGKPAVARLLNRR